MPEPRPADALIARVRFDADGLVPCVCQHAASGEVLMVAWQDAAALARTLETRRATFYSRSRGAAWVKGESSGNVLAVEAVRLDCDGDTVLCEVLPAGPACHTGTRSCFGADGGGILGRLAALFAERAASDPRDSYVARLLGAPREHVARKVGEEAVEVLLAEAGSDALAGEVADLLFHALLLLARDGRDPLDALGVLVERHRGDSPPGDGRP